MDNALNGYAIKIAMEITIPNVAIMMPAIAKPRPLRILPVFRNPLMYANGTAARPNIGTNIAPKPKIKLFRAPFPLPRPLGSAIFSDVPL